MNEPDRDGLLEEERWLEVGKQRVVYGRLVVGVVSERRRDEAGDVLLIRALARQRHL